MNNFWFKIIKRFLSYVLTLFLLISAIFILLRISPGDPVQKFISPDLHPSLAEKMKHEFALDKPLFIQYGNFIKNIFTGDFGYSYNFRQSVAAVIWTALPFTLLFSVTSFILQLTISISLVNFISKRRGMFLDKVFGKLSLAIYSIPTMIIGLFVLYLFSMKLNLFPSSDLHSIDFTNFSLLEKIFDIIWHMTLPLITLSLPGSLIFYHYLRSNVDLTYQKNFILFLKANGKNEKEIFSKHVLPNSLSPLISVIGVELGILLGGALITETIFSLPGMGRLAVNAILMRDYPLITGTVLISGIFVLLLNFVADIIKVNIDKRLKTEIL
jgi:peptide/nickel transport system permease protein